MTVVAAGALEVGFVVQAVLGIVLLVGTDQDVNGLRVRRLPDRRAAGAAGRRVVGPGRAELPGAPGFCVVAALVDAVLLARLHDIWHGPG